VVVNGERGGADVLGALAHELGHMRQDILNPDQTESGEGFYMTSIQEAQAQQFERAFWLTLDRFAEDELMAYPAYPVFRKHLSSTLDFWLRDRMRDDHSMGYLLQFLAVLDDPELSELREELLSRGSLVYGSSMALFEHLVDIEPEDAQDYVEARLESLAENREVIEAIAWGRLKEGLAPEQEGHPSLLIPALLMP
jgi:hypothetical protein